MFGKRRVMALGLGRNDAESYIPNVHKLGKALQGHCGLLFTNRPVADIVELISAFLNNFCEHQ